MELDSLSKFDIKYIKGVGEKKAQLFNKLGVFSVDDLIHFYPRKYEDWSQLTTVLNAVDGQNCFIKATMITPVQENLIRKGLTLFKCNFTDGENTINVVIFNNKYLAKSLRTFDDYVLYGKIQKTFTTASMTSPQIESVQTAIGIHPVYPATQHLTSKGIATSVKSALNRIDQIPETLSQEILKKYNLCPLDFAVRQIHFPSDIKSKDMAKNRLIFEELLTLQLGLMLLKSRKKSKNLLPITKDYSQEFYSLLPFTPTNAQTKAVQDCQKDMASSCPMNRLIQGDVGSGKTAVAGAVAYSVIKNGFQCAMMAPTEILATQHYNTFLSLFSNTDITVELLTGSTKASQKKQIKQDLIDGKIDFIIGTHSLIQNDVEFQNLALVITDEQHRFGVEQRANLAMKGNNPHLMVMSATPIPRTLGLIIYGDLDISILDELPPNRQEIRTDVVNSHYHQRLYAFIKKAIANHNQAYIVCSLVDDSENDLVSAKEYAQQLQDTVFQGYKLGLLHGKMKPKEKDEVMDKFASGDIDILVSTTVVEVGVDVPNATIMVIENADRFGLSQLHQLRGRVGRGKDKSYCVLVSDSKSESALDRLNVMKHTSDGFKIADYDLKVRGPGDFFGKRQHGLPNLVLADMMENMDTLKQCQQCAIDMLTLDPKLDTYPLLCQQITRMFNNL